MVNRLKLLKKLFFYNKKSRYISINYLPIICIVVGTVSVCLSFTLMNSIRDRIFSDIKSFEYSHKIIFDDNNFALVESILKKYDVKYFKSILNKKLIVYNGNRAHVVTANFISEKNEYFNFLNKVLPSNRNSAIIGSGLSSRLKIDDRDSINITSPINLNLLTGYVPQKKVHIDYIYNLDLFDYDINYIFLDYKDAKVFGYTDDFSFITKVKLPDKAINELLNNSNVSIITWIENHREFIDAMELETFLYNLIGISIIIISGFSFFIILSLIVIKKYKYFALMNLFGMKKKQITIYIILYSLTNAIIGSLIGFIISYLLIYIENRYEFFNYNYIKIIDVEFRLSYDYILLLLLFNIFVVLISILYPIFTTYRISINQLLNRK